MYDLTSPPTDRAAPNLPRDSRAWAAAPICGGRLAIAARWALAAVAGAQIALAAGCAAREAAGPAPGVAAAALREVWVDAAAAPGGTGSADQPHRELGAALAPATLIHLAAGLYRGPFVLPEGVVLISKGGVAVLFTEGPGAVVRSGAARLEGVSLQGGEVGAVARGALALVDVRVSGQRRAGVEVEGTGALTAERLELVGMLPDVDGVVARPGATVRLLASRLWGSLRRGVDATDATVRLERVTSEGVKELLHQEGGAATVRASAATQGSGPALFVARGALEVDGLSVRGHEYAVLTGNGARLTARRLEVRAPQRAALAVVKSRAAVRDAVLEGGAFAAVQLLESDSVLESVQIEGARANGIVVRLGKARLSKLSVRDVAADADGSGGEAGAATGGDALHLRGAEVTVRDLVVTRAAGAAVFASAAAQVEVQGLGADACQGGAVVVELGARVVARGVAVKNPGGPALVVPDASFLSVEDLVVSGTELPLWAECGAGARAVLKGVHGAPSWRPPPCVTLLAR